MTADGREGATVAICARGKAALDEAVESLEAHGVQALGIPADVSRAEDVDEVVRATVDAYGRIDVLVNNAGDAWFGRMLDTTDEEWASALEFINGASINVDGGVTRSIL